MFYFTLQHAKTWRDQYKFSIFLSKYFLWHKHDLLLLFILEQSWKEKHHHVLLTRETNTWDWAWEMIWNSPSPQRHRPSVQFSYWGQDYSSILQSHLILWEWNGRLWKIKLFTFGMRWSFTPTLMMDSLLVEDHHKIISIHAKWDQGEIYGKIWTNVTLVFSFFLMGLWALWFLWWDYWNVMLLCPLLHNATSTTATWVMKRRSLLKPNTNETQKRSAMLRTNDHWLIPFAFFLAWLNVWSTTLSLMGSLSTVFESFHTIFLT